MYSLFSIKLFVIVDKLDFRLINEIDDELMISLIIWFFFALLCGVGLRIGLGINFWRNMTISGRRTLLDLQ